MDVNSSQKAYEILRKHSQSPVEEFWIMALNSQLKLISHAMLFRGTVNACLIHPRDIIRYVCSENASSFIIAHNHPGGDPKPSREDKAITRRLFKISQMIEIPLQDHVILGDDCYYSFADHGFFQKLKNQNSFNEPLHLKN